MDHRVFLKVKIKSLAAEARIIRREERRSRHREGLHNHRTTAVRKAARSALLAYGFLRGRAYRLMEATCHAKPAWSKVKNLVTQYGVERSDDESRMEFAKREQEQEDKLVAWLEAAK